MADDYLIPPPTDINLQNLEQGADQPMPDQQLAEEISAEIEMEGVEDFNGTITNKIVQTVVARFDTADRQRCVDEQRWLQAYQNYRGFYAKNIRFTEKEKSQVFVKVTKTKVLAAYGQLIEVLFGTTKFPISIRSTEVPDGAESITHFKNTGSPDAETGAIPQNAINDIPEPISPYDRMNVGYAGDNVDVPAGARAEDVTVGMDMKVPEEDKEKFVAGAGNSGEPQFKPAQEAAKRMEKLIHDQIQESNGARELRSALFESALLGTGIIKGPFTTDKVLHRWTYDPKTKRRTYTPETVKVPKIEFCSVFDAFPDPNAFSMEECEWFIQRHKLSRTQVRALKERPYFNAEKINEVLGRTPDYANKDYENELLAENNQIYASADRYQVLEYWGIMDRKDLEEAGIDTSKNGEYLEEVQVNAWVCMGKLLRVVLNPFTPKRIPYLTFDYEKNPWSFFGVGVAENMSDSQQIMNGHARMAIDNLALAGNMVLDVDESALSPGQSYEVYPGKVFKRAIGSPGQAVYGIKFPNTAPENMAMFDKFRQIADESTGIPSYAHGQTGVMSTTRTAAGMSMLMGAATLSVKTVVKNIDDFLLKPLGEAFFQWNMAFYDGKIDIVGDLEVKAGGASSLMQNEVKSQRLTAFGQLLQNPAIAPFVKVSEYVKAFVESLELDPDELVNDTDEAQVQAQIMGTAGGVSAGPTPPTGLGQVGGVPAPTVPGDPQFSGNPTDNGAEGVESS